MIISEQSQHVVPRSKKKTFSLKALFQFKKSALYWESALRKSIHNQPSVQLPFLLSLPLFVAISVILGSIFIFQAPGYWGLMGIKLPENVLLDDLLLSIDKPYTPLANNPSRVVNPTEIVLPVSFQTYRIGTGDSLSSIANRFQVQVGTLISWNQIANARRLPVGLELEIPSYDGIRYVVKRGDSLTSIAQEKRVSYNAILDANNLDSPVLTPGQVLFLPGASLNRNELRMAMGELFIFPARGRLTSRFGWRRDPFTGVRSFHNGIDIANEVGTPVWAAKEGVVADVGYHSAFGNYVVINHDHGYQTLYGHLQSYSVRKGQSVNQGQVIARMGNTGYSTGSHLHFTVLLRNKEIDPLRILY